MQYRTRHFGLASLITMLVLGLCLFWNRPSLLQGFTNLRNAPRDSSPLWIEDRASLRLCVMVEPSLPKDEITSKVYALLVENVMHTPAWEHAGYSQAPVIDDECTSQIRIPSRRMDRFEPLGPGVTENPGPYRGVLVLLSEERADVVLGPGKLAEFGSYGLVQVDEHTFAEVIPLVVARASALEHPSMVQIYLPSLVGLLPTNHGAKP